MAINTGDTQIAIVNEVTPGTTPATPAFKILDVIPGQDLTYTHDAITSPTRQANRAGSGQRLVNFRVEGGYDVHWVRDAAVELLLEGALSGTWTTNVLKAGTADKSFTIEKKAMNGASPLYWRHTGVYVNSFGLKCDYSGNATASFGMLGMSRTTATTIVTGATYAASGSQTKLAGLDVSNVTIGSLSNLAYTSFDLNVVPEREAAGQFGVASANAISSGGRTVELSLTFFRTDFSPETLITNGVNAPVAVSFTIGTGTGNTYVVSIPAAQPSQPEDSEDSTKAMVTIKFLAKQDATAGTDIQFTRS